MALSAAMMLGATMRLVRGLASDGRLRLVMVRLMSSASTSTRWIAPGMPDSAQTSISVRSRPMPAMLSATATLKWRGKAAAALRALRAWARAAAAAEGSPELATSFPDTSPEFASFQDDGFRVVGTDRVVAARAYEPHLSRAWLRAHWYLTLGDTDLV